MPDFAALRRRKLYWTAAFNAAYDKHAELKRQLEAATWELDAAETELRSAHQALTEAGGS